METAQGFEILDGEHGNGFSCPRCAKGTSPKTFWGSSPFMFSSLLQESFQNFSPKKDGAVKMSIVLVVANIIQTPLREVSQINPQ